MSIFLSCICFFCHNLKYHSIKRHIRKCNKSNQLVRNFYSSVTLYQLCNNYEMKNVINGSLIVFVLKCCIIKLNNSSILFLLIDGNTIKDNRRNKIENKILILFL